MSYLTNEYTLWIFLVFIRHVRLINTEYTFQSQWGLMKLIILWQHCSCVSTVWLYIYKPTKNINNLLSLNIDFSFKYLKWYDVNLSCQWFFIFIIALHFNLQTLIKMVNQIILVLWLKESKSMELMLLKIRHINLWENMGLKNILSYFQVSKNNKLIIQSNKLWNINLYYLL